MDKLSFMVLLAIAVSACGANRVKVGPKVTHGGITVIEYGSDDGLVRPQEKPQEEEPARELQRLKRPEDLSPGFLYVGELANDANGCMETIRRRYSMITDMYPEPTALVEVQDCQHHSFRDEEHNTDVLRITCTLMGDGAPTPVQHVQLLVLFPKKVGPNGKDYRPAGYVMALTVPGREEPLRQCEYHGFLIPEANL